MHIYTKDICVTLDKNDILKDISVAIDQGSFIGLIGPNGSGKSTLLKSIYRVLKPQKGTIFLDDEELLKMPLKDSAKKMAVVRQFNEFNFDFKVEEIVMMGRAPHKGKFQLDTSNDYEIVYDALRKVEMEEYIDRNYSTLSGGERQRIMVARALVQQADFFILDEPTNHLDIKYQIQLLNLIKSLDKTVFAALHDLNLAAAYCEKIYAMKDGYIRAHGTPEQVINKKVIKEIFDIDVEVIQHPTNGRPYIIYNT